MWSGVFEPIVEGGASSSEITRVVKLPVETFVRIARGGGFLIEYTTSATNYSSFIFSRGLSSTEERVTVQKNTNPGGSSTHRFFVSVDKDALAKCSVVQVVDSPTGVPQKIGVLLVETFYEEKVLEKAPSAPESRASVMEPAASNDSIVYFSGNFIDGTRIARRFERLKNRRGYKYIDDLNNASFIVDNEDSELLRRIINMYVLSGELAVNQKEDDAKCCDIPLTRIFFGKYAARPKAVPLLMQLFEKYQALVAEYENSASPIAGVDFFDFDANHKGPASSEALSKLSPPKDPVVYFSISEKGVKIWQRSFEFFDNPPGCYYKDSLAKKGAIVKQSDFELLLRTLSSDIVKGAMRLKTEEDKRQPGAALTRIFFGQYSAKISSVPVLLKLFTKYQKVAEKN